MVKATNKTKGNPQLCVHYWMIEQGGNGPISKGQCIKCDLTKEFNNSISEKKKCKESDQKKESDHKKEAVKMVA